MKSFLFVISVLFFSGCATKSIVSRPPPVVEPTPQAQPSATSSTSIDMLGLQKYLGLSRASETLGYQEKTFQTCQAGNGFSSHQNCETKHFVVIHFQLMCRDSEGTISTILTLADLQPVAHRPVIWTLKNISKTIETDEQGYGQIALISGASQSQQRLKLSLGNDFLYTRAGEITRIATPPSWCSSSQAQR